MYSQFIATRDKHCHLRVNILQTNNTWQRNVVSYKTNQTLHVITLLYRDLYITVTSAVRT